MEYDSEDGNLKKIINPEGHQTIYEYDQHGFPSKITAKAVADAQGVTTDIVTSMGYEYMSGWKLWEKSPRGYVVQYEYDGLGRTIKVVGPDDDDELGWTPEDGTALFRSNNPETVNEFDDVNLDAVLYDALGNKTKYDFDVLGRLVSLVKYEREDNQYLEAAITNLTYDKWGNITEIIDPNGNAVGPVWAHTTKYEYDAMGRNSAIIYPDETSSWSDNPRKEMDFDYSTNTLTIIDEESNRVKEFYDMQSRVVRQVIYNEGQEIESKKYYDGVGNEVIAIAMALDPKESKTFKEYNDLNQLVKVTLPTETVWENGYSVTVTPYQRFVYNKAGQKIKDIVSRGSGT